MTRDKRETESRGGAKGSLGQQAPGAMGQPAPSSRRTTRQAPLPSAAKSATKSTDASHAAGPVVYDSDGTIRTPKSLLGNGITTFAGARGSKLMGLMSTMIDETTASNQAGEASEDKLFMGKFPSIGQFSTMTSMTPTQSDVGEDLDRNRSVSSSWDVAARLGEVASVADSAQGSVKGAPTGPSAPKPKPVVKVMPRVPAVAAAKDLEKVVTVTLQETDTVVLLEKHSLAVNAESEEGALVTAANEKYEELLRVKVGNDNYTDNACQTLVNLMLLTKNKEVQTVDAERFDMTTQWDLEATLDANVQVEAEEAAPMREAGRFTMGASILPPDAVNVVLGGSETKKTITGMASVSGGSSVSKTSLMESQSTMNYAHKKVDDILAALNPVAVAAQTGEDAAAQQEQDAAQKLEELEGLVEALELVESIVTHNAHVDQMLLYQGMEPLSDMLGSWRLRKRRAPGAAEADSASVALERIDDAGSVTESQATKDTRSSAARGDATASSAADGDKDVDPAIESVPSIATSATAAALTATAAGLSRMQLLWQWKCDLTEGRNVSSLSWNSDRANLVAVGYGSFNFGKTSDGLVCIWSMKNPKYPLWSFHTQSGVTALNFSKATGGVLAVGFYDGNVAVYDVKSRNPSPAIKSDGSTGRHSDPVWKVRWTDTGDIATTFVSISTDGRVTRWRVSKGVEYDDLMKLKRTVRRDAVYANHKMANVARNLKQEAFVSRLTSGTAFDFLKEDDRMYIAATEDGWIHKCSTSYSEQYMASYKGHMGAVYNVQWCPFDPSLFISCSADWTIRLWRESRTTSLLTFSTGSDEVMDVQWCPSNSTVFATGTSGGRVEIWDFSVSTLRPIALHHAPDVKITAVAFNDVHNVVVAGDNQGGVMVFRLFDVMQRMESEEAQVRRLAEAMDANVIKAEKAEGKPRPDAAD